MISITVSDAIHTMVLQLLIGLSLDCQNAHIMHRF